MTALIALLVLQGGAPAQESPQESTQKPKASTIVSRMLEYYKKANSLVGTVHLTQTAAGKSITIDTQLQFEKPSKLFLHQVRKSSDPREWVVTSDGKLFSYNAPETVSIRPQRLIEPVAASPGTQRKLGDYSTGVVHYVGEMYNAATYSIGDKSPLLDVAFAQSGDLKYLTGQLATMVYRGTTELAGKKVHVIIGEWRENPAVPSSGVYEMYIDEDGNFLRYVLKQDFAVPEAPQQSITVSSIWDGRLTVNAKPNPALFTVLR